MSKNPYAQVALTYLRRPFSSSRTGAMVIGFLGMTVLSVVGRRPNVSGHGNHFMPLLWMGAAFLFGMLAIHIKEQFSNPQSHLTPGFCRIHIMVAAMAVLISAIILPAVLTGLAGLHSIGLIAIMILIFGAVFWLVLIQSTLLGWLLAVPLLIAITEPGKRALEQLCSGRFETNAVAILGLGVAITLLGGLRLIRLNEDMPDYHCRWGDGEKNQMAGRGPSIDRTLPRGLRERLAENKMAGLTQHAQHAATSRWSRVCRWQVGMPTGWSAWWHSFALVLYLAAVTWMTSTSTQSWIVVLTLFSCLVPVGALWGTLWRRRNRTLQYEFLLPVDRATYLKQMGAAAALSQLQLWVVASAALILLWQFMGQQPTSFTLAYVLAFSALVQIWLFGVVVWLLRYRSLILAVLAFMLAVQLLVIPLLALEPGPLVQWRYTALSVVGMFAVFGLLLTYDAYRRWLVADFD